MAGRGVHAAVPGVGGLGGVAFGGGRYRCPGRAFAEMELALVVGLVLCCLDVELEVGGEGTGVASPGDAGGGLPPPNLGKLVGVKVPAGPCWGTVRERERR